MPANSPFRRGACGVAVSDIVGPSGLLDRMAVTAHPPMVAFTRPHAGQIVAAERVHLSWHGGDSDGGRLLYTLLDSGDGGTTWTPLAVEQTASEADVRLGPGSHVLRLIADDGVNAATADARITVRARSR